MRRAAIVIGVLLGLLGPAPAGAEDATGTTIRAERPDETRPAAPSLEARHGMPSLEALTATRERPLFRRDRRPPPIAAAPPQPIRPPVADVGEQVFAPKLLGIVIGPEVRLVLVQATSGATPLRLRLDDELEGWTVDAITSRSVVFRKGEREITVPLTKPRAAADGEDPAAGVDTSGDDGR